MPDNNSRPNREPGLGKTLREDLRRGDFGRTMHRDYKELKDFYLTDDRKARLKKMKRVKRAILTFVWLLKALFLKLTPARRLLLILAIIFVIVPHSYAYNDNRVQISIETSSFAVFLLLFVLRSKSVV